MKAMSDLLKNYFKEKTGERLGQYFVNRYIKKPEPGLFHSNLFSAEYVEIQQWLIDNQYTDELPQIVDKELA